MTTTTSKTTNEVAKAPQQQVAQQQTQQPLTLKGALSQESIVKRFNEVLGSKANGFITSIINVVNSSQDLSKADVNSIVMSSFVASTLDLPIDKNLAFCYLVPYNVKTKDGYKTMASLQIGYRGFVQLAIRSGQYKSINTSNVYEGELQEVNRLTGEIKFDATKKKSDKVVGYVAYFSLLNGFEKTLYMTKEEISEHAKKYSKTFTSEFGLWNKEFDAMARKTILKTLLSKYGILSSEMQKAITTDHAVVKDFDGNVEYPDNNPIMEVKEIDMPETPFEEVKAESQPQAQQPQTSPAIPKANAPKEQGQIKF